MSNYSAPFTLTIITIYYSDTINISNLKKNILTIITIQYIVTQSTIFQLFDFLVYTVWACLKGMTPYNTLKKKSTNKNHYDDNYSAFHIRDARSFALITYLSLVPVYVLSRFQPRHRHCHSTHFALKGYPHRCVLGTATLPYFHWDCQYQHISNVALLLVQKSKIDERIEQMQFVKLQTEERIS